MNPNHHDNLSQGFDTGVAGGAPRVLVVDDEPQIVSFLLELLEDEGYHTDSAVDGRDAMKKIRQESPQVVISDVMMPKLSGHDLVRYISQSPDMEHPRVILISAVVDQSPDPEVPLLQKPFDVEELLTLVDDAVENGTTGYRAS